MLLDGVTLVVSPLIALMEDQVKALSRKGIPAACINSSLPASEIALRLDQAANGALKLLYLTPERITTESFARMARYLPVSLLAVVEAHCISLWGHDFRPAYREIVRARDFFPVPTIALTATATRETAADICRSLRFSEDFQVVRESFRRENISYQVGENESVATELLEPSCIAVHVPRCWLRRGCWKKTAFRPENTTRDCPLLSARGLCASGSREKNA